MKSSALRKREFTVFEKILFTLTGALIFGTMWSLRGSHGWGSEWGVFTVGMLFIIYVYALFKRKSLSSYFHITAACASCMLTVPAWGTLLNQTSGYFENSAKEMLIDKTAECSPLSGVFIMLCLGIGSIPLYLFILSRLFSDKKYGFVKYVIVIGIYFAVYYLAMATVAHPILNAVQPESAAAFEQGLAAHGKEATAYAYYMKHFASINSAKKIDFGRNYFTEIAVISKSIAVIVTSLAVRFGLKDRAGGKIMFWGSLSFGVGITAADVFFVLKNTVGKEKYPVFGSAWGLWEYFTGFISGLFIMIILFAVNKMTDEMNIKNDFVPFIPEKIRNIIACTFSFAMLGIAFIRPFAVRFDGIKAVSIAIYAVGGIAVAVIFALTLSGKIRLFTEKSVHTVCAVAFPVILSLNEIAYFFTGTSECLPRIAEIDCVAVLNAISFFAVSVIYLAKRKKFVSE